MKKRIHINQHAIRRNAKGLDADYFYEPEPVITVKTYKSNDYGFVVDIHGPSVVVYNPDTPLSCGAKVWVETEAEVIIDAHISIK